MRKVPHVIKADEHIVTFAPGIRTVACSNHQILNNHPELFTIARNYKAFDDLDGGSPVSSCVYHLRSDLTVIQNMIAIPEVDGRPGNFLTHDLIIAQKEYTRYLIEISNLLQIGKMPFRKTWDIEAEEHQGQKHEIPLDRSLKEIGSIFISRPFQSEHLFSDLVFLLLKRIQNRQKRNPVRLLLPPQAFIPKKCGHCSTALEICLQIINCLPIQFKHLVSYRSYLFDLSDSFLGENEKENMIDLQIFCSSLADSNLKAIELSEFDSSYRISFPNDYTYFGAVAASAGLEESLSCLWQMFSNFSDPGMITGRYEDRYSLMDRVLIGFGLIKRKSESDRRRKEIDQLHPKLKDALMGSYSWSELVKSTKEADKPFIYAIWLGAVAKQIKKKIASLNTVAESFLALLVAFRGLNNSQSVGVNQIYHIFFCFVKDILSDRPTVDTETFRNISIQFKSCFGKNADLEKQDSYLENKVVQCFQKQDIFKLIVLFNRRIGSDCFLRKNLIGYLFSIPVMDEIKLKVKSRKYFEVFSEFICPTPFGYCDEDMLKETVNGLVKYRLYVFLGPLFSNLLDQDIILHNKFLAELKRYIKISYSFEPR